MRILFVCSRNRLRSPTAEELFSTYPGVETASAGTSPDAENPVSADLVEWAELIVAMESVHKRRLNGKFGPLLKTRRIAVLGIPDNYAYMDEALVALLKQRMTSYLSSQHRE